MAWLYVPELADSNSRSGFSATSIELWVTSSGMPTRRPLSWRGWKTRPWIARLSGTTLPHSTADAGVDSWIASRLAIRASRSRSPDGSSESMIRDIYGRISGGLLAKYSPSSSFSKTSLATSKTALRLFEPIYSEWVTDLMQDCLARRKLAHLTNDSDFSRLLDDETWPTPRAEDSESCGNHPNQSDSLTGVTRSEMTWATPTSHDEKNPRAPAQRGKRGYRDLSDDATTWSTPNTSDSEGMSGGENRKSSLRNDSKNWDSPKVARGDWGKDGKEGEPRLNLSGQAKAETWATPASADQQGSHGGGQGRSLRTDISEMYPTPAATPYGSSQNGINRTRPSAGTPSLETMAQRGMWPTPAARDEKGANSEMHVTETGTGRRHMDQLANSVAHMPSDSSLQDEPTSTDGEPRSKSTRLLNPRFVEWLMSWPLGMTACDAPVTEFIVWRQRWRSFLFSAGAIE